MRSLGRFITPMIAFIGIQLAWVLVVLIWIRWFIGTHQRLRELAEKYSPELLHSQVNWLLLVEGLLLLAVILGGVYVIFIYWRRQSALNREQRAFISQMSHELKSPLASLQLHLETVRRHPLPPEKLAGFVDTMLADVRRLNGLITNLLEANRLESRAPRLVLRAACLSEFVERYCAEEAAFLPGGTRLELSVDRDLWARFDAGSLSMTLRNLLENAVLYSPTPARIEVRLTADVNNCLLVVRDQGRGIEPAEHKKVFRMFYRGQRSEDSIPGSGLGLFIARAVIRRHGGRIWIESKGADRGTAVHLSLPRVSVPPEEAAHAG